jgi:ribonuclease HI
VKKLIINTDGGARNNPGPAALGVVIADEWGHILETHKEYLGKATNNVAEYRALIEGLRRSKKYEADEIECRLDSELVVRQVTGQYKTKDPNMKALLSEVRELSFFKNIIFSYVPREQNKLADKLVNEALDEYADSNR